MTVSLQIVSADPRNDHTRTVPDGATVRVTLAGSGQARLDISFPEAAAARPCDRLETPLPSGWTLGADGTRLSPREA